MRSSCVLLLLLLLAGLAELTPSARSQSLSIERRPSHELWVTARAPASAPHVLQGSPNLRLWVDLAEEFSGQVARRIDAPGATARYVRLVPVPEPAPPINIVLIGDSTVADLLSNSGVFNGWGQGMYGYFKPHARVVNLAMPGYSSRTFLGSAEKTSMLAIKPEYVLVGFGLIDEFGTEAQRTSLEEYTENLRNIVETIRSFGGTPILVTPTVLRYFDDRDRVIPVYQDRTAVVKQVAASLQTHLINLNALSTDLMNELGNAGSAYIWYGDNYIHFSDLGARVLAQLVVNELPEALGPYLIGSLDPRPKP